MTPELQEQIDHITSDVEELTVTQGEHQGKNMFVMPWQSEIIEAMVQFKDIGFSIARSNGKTTFIAALACSAIRPGGALFVPRGEIVIVASSLNQAGICFSHVMHFLRPWTYGNSGKLDRNLWKIADNHHVKSIEYKPSGTIIKALGSDHRRAHGLAPSFAILDEPAQWVGGGEKMYNAVTTGMGKQKNPKVFAIGTQSDSPNHFFQRMLNSPSKTTWTKVYAGEPGGDDFSEENIRKANPSFDYMPSLRDDLSGAMERVKAGSLRIHAYRAYNLNLGTPETEGREVLVPVSNWEQCVKKNPNERDGPVAVGVDLGGGVSMSAVAFYWPVTGRLETYAAYPSRPSLLERGKQDGVDDLYERMFNRGEISIIGDFKTDNVEFLKRCFSLINGYKRITITADAYAKTSLKQALFELGMDFDRDVDPRRVGRGPHGKEDIESFQSEVLDGHLNVGENLCLDYAISKAAINRDTNGNPYLDKREQKGRIDVVQAAVLAVGTGHRWRKPSEKNTIAEIHRQLAADGEIVKGV